MHNVLGNQCCKPCCTMQTVVCNIAEVKNYPTSAAFPAIIIAHIVAPCVCTLTEAKNPDVWAVAQVL